MDLGNQNRQEQAQGWEIARYFSICGAHSSLSVVYPTSTNFMALSVLSINSNKAVFRILDVHPKGGGNG